jgi:hypothetical protein
MSPDLWNRSLSEISRFVKIGSTSRFRPILPVIAKLHRFLELCAHLGKHFHRTDASAPKAFSRAGYSAHDEANRRDGARELCFLSASDARAPHIHDPPRDNACGSALRRSIPRFRHRAQIDDPAARRPGSFQCVGDLLGPVHVARRSASQKNAGVRTCILQFVTNS